MAIRLTNKEILFHLIQNNLGTYQNEQTRNSIIQNFFPENEGNFLKENIHITK